MTKIVFSLLALVLIAPAVQAQLSPQSIDLLCNNNDRSQDANDMCRGRLQLYNETFDPRAVQARQAQERQEQERLEQAQREREEQERMEWQEQERQEQERQEQERKARQEQAQREREEQERRERLGFVIMDNTTACYSRRSWNDMKIAVTRNDIDTFELLLRDGSCRTIPRWTEGEIVKEPTLFDMTFQVLLDLQLIRNQRLMPPVRMWMEESHFVTCRALANSTNRTRVRQYRQNMPPGVCD